MREQPRRRRWPWLVLAGGGLVALGWHWLFRAVTDYLHANLSERDQYSSVYSLPIGAVALVVAIVALFWQIRQDQTGRDTSVGPVAAPAAGMTSLSAPYPSTVEQVRGRDALISELTRRYRWRPGRRPGVHVLHGMGGSGKTTVALQVAHHLQEKGTAVWWISAAEDSDLQNGMRRLARRLDATLQQLDQDWADNAFDVLWSRLDTSPRRWLLVIDNADDLDLLTPHGDNVAQQRGWIRPPATGRGMVLVTSRNSDPAAWGGWCRLHPVAMLPSADGARVLTDRAGPRAGTSDQAAALAVRLGGLPLALTIAGRYLADASRLRLPGAITTYAAYQDALTTAGLAAVFATPGCPLTDSQARAVIARTWELSLTLLERRGLAPTRTLLRVLSVLADAPIPYEVLLDPAEMARSPLLPGTDAAQLRAWLDGLITLNLLELITGTTEADTATVPLRLHPLIRDASLYHLNTSEQQQPALALAARLLDRATAQVGASDHPAGWPVWQLLTPHPLHVLTALVCRPEPNLDAVDDAATAALRITEYSAATGQYVLAQTQATTIRDTSTRILGPEHPTTLEARDDVANWTGQAGDAVAARDQYAVLLPIRERVLGVEHPDTLTTRNELAYWNTQLMVDRLAPTEPVASESRHWLAWTKRILPVPEDRKAPGQNKPSQSGSGTGFR
jgi:NB-ARC domain-containing protein